MNRAIKYRIYPTIEQKSLFAQTFGCCRKVWNLMLSDKIDSYGTSGKFITVTPAMYKTDYPYLRDVDSLALANVQLNLQTAFRNCFDKFRKKTAGFPKFKSAKRNRRSYTTNNQRGTIRIDGSFIKLPKAGLIKAVIHRRPNACWIIKSATVSQESDSRYYISILFEYPDTPANYVPDQNNAIGLDYSSEHLYIDSNGDKGSFHKYYRESHKKLARAQKKLSRMQGSKKNEIKSNNYYKQLKKLNKIHRHISNQRLDNLHKLSAGIANRYDIVCVESLDMRAMSNKGFGNGKATMDNGYGMFLNMLRYKLSDKGKLLIRIDKWYPSSQICHVCGTQNPKTKDLSVRKWRCPCCGTTHDRDVNAAINIKNEGLRMLGAA